MILGVKSMLTPRELAEAIGVSESSLKRWADAGLVRVTRTGGGHRRISLAEATRFIRERHATVVRPDILGLPRLECAEGSSEADRLYHYLCEGQAALARGTLMTMYLEGRTIAEICDGPLRESLTRLGELWRHSDVGIMVEHRATDIVVGALNQLRAAVAGREGPLAVGCAPAGDPYFVTTLMAAMVLESVGMHPVNLGADTPLGALRHAIATYEPRLVWVSVMSEEAATDAAADYAALADELDRQGIALVIGGRHRAALAAPQRPRERVYIASSMGELAAFGQALGSQR